MADQTQTTDQKKAATAEAKQPKVAEPLVPTAEQPFNPAKVSLPELLGKLLAACVYDRTAVPQARRDLYVWYQAQPLENRKETARAMREHLETAKQVSEALFQTGIELVAGDL